MAHHSLAICVLSVLRVRRAGGPTLRPNACMREKLHCTVRQCFARFPRANQAKIRTTLQPKCSQGHIPASPCPTNLLHPCAIFITSSHIPSFSTRASVRRSQPPGVLRRVSGCYTRQEAAVAVVPYSSVARRGYRRSGGLWGRPCCAHPARRAASGSPAGSVRSAGGVSSRSLGGGGCAPPSVSETLNPVVHVHLSPSPMLPLLLPLPPPNSHPAKKDRV
jgi:hypothetical protein